MTSPLEKAVTNRDCFLLCKHIFDKDGVAAGGVVDKDVGYRADEFAVLNNGATAHECVNIGPIT